MPKSQDYTPIPPAAVMPGRMLMECELQRQQMSRTDDDEEACAATAKNNNNDEERQCRICLESDFPHTMIAPCRCKGSSQWVHRDCLDEWRIHEEDRAFSHCTECQFQYHFVDTGHAERQRKLQTRFCWFVSRDVCLVTVVIQIIILSLAWLVRLVDVYNNQVLLHVLCPDCGSEAGNDAQPRDDTTNSTVIPFDDNNTTQGHFNHEEFAIYYAYGFLVLLVCLGMMGSIVLCKNKCQISKIKETYTNNNYQDENNAENNSATTSNEETRGITSGGQNNNNNSNHFEKRNQFYQSQRHRRQQRNDDQQQPSSCCSCCCTPNNAYEGVGPQPYFYYYPTYYGGGGDDCCCCCCCDDNTNDCSADGCCCPSLYHHTGGGGGGNSDGCNDGMHILLVIMLVVVLVMAVIGFVVGIFLSIFVVQRIIQRHIVLLEKRRLVDDFPVQDLSRYDLTQMDLEPDAEVALPALSRKIAPPPTRTSLRPEDSSHLKKMGLLD